MNIKGIAFTVVGAILALSLLIMGMGGITHVEPGEVGILIKTIGADRGMQKETMSTGTHWVNPWTYDTAIYDTRITQYPLNNIQAQTGDGQPITLDMTFTVSLSDDKVPELHQRLGHNYWSRIAQVADSSIKNHTTNQSSDTVYTGAGRVNIQNGINSDLAAQFEQYGIKVVANLNDLKFQNHEFVAVLEQKAAAAQGEEINKRKAVAAEQEAIRVENEARGQKLKSIQESEGRRESLRLEGEGNRLRDEATAAGNLALAKAKAEGLRLENDALSGVGAKYIASMEWAKFMGPNVKVYGVPTGAPGTSTFMFDEAMRQAALPAAVAGAQGR